MVEIVMTAQSRVAFCGVCSHTWQHQDHVCRCASAISPHIHNPAMPPCPKCGKPAQMSRPA